MQSQNENILQNHTKLGGGGKEKPLTFTVNISDFSKERPIGISGLLRTKNGADFLSDCIDSCINALDELIIVYQESSDDTEKIIIEKQKQYPDKIRFYFYEPKVYSHNLTEEEYNYASNLKEDSIHLLSNYYNFALSKAKYKYAIKIDDDQIYFSEKLKEILDLYRTNKKVKISLIEEIAFKYYNKLYKRTKKHPEYLNSFTCNILVPKFFTKNLTSYLKKKVQNDKIIISFSGINIFEDKIPLGSFETPYLQSPFNGTFDTICFPISSETYYIPLQDKQNNRIIEKFNNPFSNSKEPKVFSLGFFWIHLKDMKKTVYKEAEQKYYGKCIETDKFLNSNLFKLEEETKYRSFNWLRLIYYIFFIEEKSLLKNQLKRYIETHTEQIYE